MTYIMLKARDCWILGQVVGRDIDLLAGVNLDATAWQFPITIIVPAEVKFLLAQVAQRVASASGSSAALNTMTNIDILPMTHLTAFIDTHSIFGLIDSNEKNKIVEMYVGLVAGVNEARANA